MRIGNYEILKANQWCYQLYRVMPVGWNSKKRTRNSPLDGRRLVAIECYSNTIAAAIRRCAEFCERDEIDTDDLNSTVERIERLHKSINELADKIADKARC